MATSASHRWPRMTLLPGFIDGHVHVRDAGELRQALASA
jgi:dihydroorotase-like cyclic amidohydrolase